ncbi:MAG: hypothetical protein LUC86_02910 [Prevotellaceae bacterium]|nr:hypothetical protein [Prevotellaceae bacterium]
MTAKDGIIFLDFDGVLNSLRGYRKAREEGRQTGDEYGTAFDCDCVAALRKIVDATGVSIVVTSSWRYILDKDDIRKMWSDRQLPGLVYSVTPTDLLIDPEERCKRGIEINAWLMAHGASVNYVILDDDEDFLPYQLPHLVHTNPETGLTAADADRALQMINHILN